MKTQSWNGAPVAKDTPRVAEHRRAANKDVHRLAAAFTQYRQNRPLPLDGYRVRLIGVGQLPVALTDLGPDDIEALITYLTTTPTPPITHHPSPIEALPSR